MKQIIFIVILIFAFCFAAFAQANENVKAAPQTTLKLLAQFNHADNEWYKLTVEILGEALLNDSSATGLVRIKNDKNFARRLHLLTKGFAFRKMDLSSVTFLIVDEQEHDTDVLLASNCMEIPKCENCIVIRAKDVDKIEKLFRPKTVIKRRKRK